MTQFASTLYPQTNPTNPILLGIRTDRDVKGEPVNYWIELQLLRFDPAGPARDHALKVLTRLFALSG